MSLILTLDTALDACTVALGRSGVLVAGRHEPMRRGQAEALAPMIDAVMAEAGARPAALDAIAVTVGPGAFTGMRIGIAAARGLALALDRPAFGLTTTEAIAASQPEAGVGATSSEVGAPLLIAIETKRQDLYLALVPAGRGAGGGSAPVACPPEEAVAWLEKTGAAGWRKGLLLAGDGTARAGAALTAAGLHWRPAGGPALPAPEALATLAEAARVAGPPGTPPEPLYLRPPDATPPRPPAWRAAPGDGRDS
ncbi:tRNA (adenosine(37)-N6)-threonylcarbamoyltransferase complex dimerization subunit type 1 TsaB [Marivibrio halodurans]|uniref:tRNA (Adenosine(37)-N6)-threonylcarbamoyltransferase complex dimerization subunit type 1 TsaB n=1 Tax=Marivibrio halodurans TaxID=2039722 RepID=A0A8J7V3G1_9PROT|nr:tRNA (adenosine(37)-N6)-threonylcarbamoyltransferase complex dimerization subunit type 1 TsaB [Marivibrio halodurans]MBP5858206.1 tRNA (adenosine(37)-N6)-threonylcarbamoyltransferase complex dimerization subunit type 1 TsaB [Marivibrio halodurans]